MAVPPSILFVGAGLAATRAIEQLRSLGVDSRITLVGAEQHLPYDRPPLSKDVLRGEREDSPLRAEWAELDVGVHVGRRAAAVHAGPRTVLLDDGEELGYDALVVATGATPRRLPGISGPGAHVLRTLENARAPAPWAPRSPCWSSSPPPWRGSWVRRWPRRWPRCTSAKGSRCAAGSPSSKPGARAPTGSCCSPTAARCRRPSSW